MGKISSGLGLSHLSKCGWVKTGPDTGRKFPEKKLGIKTTGKLAKSLASFMKRMKY